MTLDWKTCLRMAVSIFLLYLGIHYWPNAVQLGSLFLGAATPLLIGAVIAYLINILMSFYEQRCFRNTQNGKLIPFRRPLCMIAAFATLISVVVLVFWLILPQFVECIQLCGQLIAAELPEFLETVTTWIDEVGVLPEKISATLVGIDWKGKIGQLIAALSSGLGNMMDIVLSAASSVVSVVMNVVLGLMFAIYLLLGKETILRQFGLLTNRYLKPDCNRKLKHILQTVNECFHKYIVGQCLEAVILGMLCTLGMLILRLPYAAMIGALIAFTALIPVAGAYIGGGVGAFMILTVSPVKAVIFLVFLVVLQQIEGNLIYPRVVGSSMGLPAIWVLAAVTVGGGVMGIPGMLLGVPVAAAAYRLLRESVTNTEDGDDANSCCVEVGSKNGI